MDIFFSSFLKFFGILLFFVFFGYKKVCFCEKVVVYMIFDGFPLLKSFFFKKQRLGCSVNFDGKCNLDRLGVVVGC